MTTMRPIIRALLWILVGANIGYLSIQANRVPVQVIVEQVPVALHATDAKALAKELLTKKSYECLLKIVHAESRWNSKAKNPDSSARGLGQLLNQTYTNLGMKHSTNEKAQLIATLAYIGRKYGSGGPCAAWRFHQKHNYY